ncbi:MAG: Uma2 family endonuclease [Armatimonadetes bacterium]|nr:Uma2 family endonuclease [Armatimonadota bacterium]
MAIKHDTPLPTEPVVIVPNQTEELLYTRAMLEFLENSGLIEGRFELVNGRIYSKMGQNLPHSLSVGRLTRYLNGIESFQSERVVSDVLLNLAPEREHPAPDVLVLREYKGKGKPAGSDLLLAVEVSDTTQSRDFGGKVETYARAGIAEYWVLELPKRTLTVFRTPDAVAGTWGSRNTLAETQTIAPESAPDALIRISELLPLTD